MINKQLILRVKIKIWARITSMYNILKNKPKKNPPNVWIVSPR